ncbi:asparagine synthase [Halosimplex carlsbadense 2-9-1]|uniref:Putative asparagine synthetase [glutamine-hydrolyzing] n=1 Tax=Halosimplex carlsbadense 2-9-1 TaxID=797114 RepID=M0D6J9_9EURY|nr:asparagine synthase-related protein [Halosimplex carlsbadense]ELZ30322.1 asparagine synthase [Halosimplex carlsbadense 2-9-1]
MSGIVALFDRGRGGVDSDLEAMHERIAHRGPDGDETWCDGTVGLGHQQLRSTPEAEHDDQPYRDGAAVVAGDIRLDNRATLLNALDVANGGKPVPDSRLVLAAYRRWGEACPEHLVGSFAFALWDSAAGRLFCARDCFGVKPLYYHSGPDTFAVGSEPKALVALPDVDRTPDERKIGDLLTGTFEDKERTYYRDIDRLPPAHAISVRSDGIRTWQYWDLDPTDSISLGSDAAYERRFRELFEQAVRSRLRTDGAVGTALSGGLDSSSITVVARDLLSSTEPLFAFSNVYDDAPASDEREFIELVTEREGIDSQYVFMDGIGMFDDRESMGWHYDQPPHDTMHHAIWERMKRVDETGGNVVLEGALGDSATGYGLGLIPELLRTGRWRRLAAEIQAISELGGARRHRVFLRHAVAPLVPPAVRRTYRRVRDRPVLAGRKNPTLRPEFVDRVGLDEKLRERYATGSVLKETARRRQCRSLTFGTITASLETTDLVAAAFGVEPRYPFTDRRLVEFSLAMPPTQQLSEGWTRSIIRRSLADLLPEEIRTRVWKTDMSQGFWNSLAREDDRLRRLVGDPGPIERFVDPDALRAARERFTETQNTRDARALWRALSLSTWMQTWVHTNDELREPPRALGDDSRP